MSIPEDTHVIIADDDPQARKLIHHILENAGVSTICMAEDGDQVISIVDEFKPDVILLDLVMPNMGGIEVIKKIRDTNQQVQIIVVSAHEDPKQLNQAIKHGANGFLTKFQLSSHLAKSISAALSGNFAVVDPQLLQQAVTTRSNLVDRVDFETKNGMSERLENLTPREKTVLNLIAKGYDNSGIADKLFISYNTVKSHIARIFNKLEVDDRTQAAVIALQGGLLDEE